MSTTKVNADVLDLTDDYAFTGTITGAGGLTLGTEQATTSGTGVTFSGIPSGTALIHIMFEGVSLTDASPIDITIGDAGGLETSGYHGSATNITNGGNPLGNGDNTAEFQIKSVHADNKFHGTMILSLKDSANFTWTMMCVTGGVSNETYVSGGSKSLSAVLTQVRISGGTFDTGSINISYMAGA
jgi:hypothetical protein